MNLLDETPFASLFRRRGYDPESAAQLSKAIQAKPVQPTETMQRYSERVSQPHNLLGMAKSGMNMAFPGIGNLLQMPANHLLHEWDMIDEGAYKLGEKATDAVSPYVPAEVAGGLGAATYLAGNILAPDGVPGPNNAMVFYHGSPHKFSKFSSKAIGSGEGAQAYGHGLYFAENPGVAGTYKKKLTKRGAYSIDGSPVDENTVAHQQLPLQIAAIDGDKGLREFIENYDKRIAGGEKLPIDVLDELDFAESLLGKKVTRAEGSLYTVDIPDEAVDRMLDWDAPLSEQPEAVREALSRAGLFDPDAKKRADEIIAETERMALDRDPVTNRMREEKRWHELVRERDALLERAGDVTGERLYHLLKDRQRTKAPLMNIDSAWSKAAKNMIENGVDPREGLRQAYPDISPKEIEGAIVDALGGYAPVVSRTLQDLGIPGIKYYDGNSRAAGKGTRNVVVFDDSIIKMLERNGERIE